MGVVSSFWIKSFKVLLHLRRLLFVCLFLILRVCSCFGPAPRTGTEATTGCFQSLFARVVVLPFYQKIEILKTQNISSHSYSTESFNDKECVTTSHPVKFQSFGQSGRKIRSFWTLRIRDIYQRRSLSINALRVCVYIYIQQLSSFRALT